MSEKKIAFSYANVAKDLPFIAFIRTKTAKGKYFYDFPSLQDRERLDFSPFDKISTDQDGCLDIVHWSDKDKLTQAIRISEKTWRHRTNISALFCRPGKRGGWRDRPCRKTKERKYRLERVLAGRYKRKEKRLF